MENEFPTVVYAFQMNYAVDLEFESCEKVYETLGFTTVAADLLCVENKLNDPTFNFTRNPYHSSQALIEIYFNNDTNINYTESFMAITGMTYDEFNRAFFDEGSKFDQFIAAKVTGPVYE